MAIEISTYYLGCTIWGIFLSLTILAVYRYYKCDDDPLPLIPLILFDVAGLFSFVIYNGLIKLV